MEMSSNNYTSLPSAAAAMKMSSNNSTSLPSSAMLTVNDIFKVYKGRRAGIIHALTIDIDKFYTLCDPEKEELCLYGHPDGSWEVTMPMEEVPPEPPPGINFAKDRLDRKDWLLAVAVHCNSWLLSVAFFMGGFFMNGNDRKHLFSMINDLPTVFEVVAERKQAKDKTSADIGSKFRLSTKRSNDGQIKCNSKPVDEGYFEDEDEHSETLCGTCGGNYSAKEFWIGCDICERWFHGKCVKITPAKAESIKQYKCPSCSSKKVRP